VKCRASAGIANTPYVISCRIVTASLHRDETIEASLYLMHPLIPL